MKELGRSYTVSEELMVKREIYICSLYGKSGADVNYARYALFCKDKTNDLILNLTPENVTQHSRIVTTTRKGSSTPTKMSKIIGRQIH